MFERFQSLDSFAKSSYVLGSEAWEEYSRWVVRFNQRLCAEVRLYGEHANVHQSHSQNDSGDLRGMVTHYYHSKQ